MFCRCLKYIRCLKKKKRKEEDLCAVVWVICSLKPLNYFAVCLALVLMEISSFLDAKGSNQMINIHSKYAHTLKHKHTPFEQCIYVCFLQCCNYRPLILSQPNLNIKQHLIYTLLHPDDIRELLSKQVRQPQSVSSMHI